MELFISWSGVQSKNIAEAIREWVPCVVQAVKPYYTPEDINKGQRWSSEISKKLESSKVGIIILTPYNLDAPWLMFEAGALSKSFESSSVCPILFGVKPTDVKGPLVQFQCSEFGKQEMLKLLKSINEHLGEQKLEEKTLISIFEVFWPKLEEQISQILQQPQQGQGKPSGRTDRDILEEVLRLTRKSTYSHSRTEPSNKINVFLEEKELVTFDPNNHVITFWDGRTEVYDFSLERLSSASEVLDWFLQVNQKNWCTGDHLKAFANCIEEVSDLYFNKNAQGVFCPGGANLEPNWKEAIDSIG